jgi:hypothetical protein
MLGKRLLLVAGVFFGGLLVLNGVAYRSNAAASARQMEATAMVEAAAARDLLDLSLINRREIEILVGKELLVAGRVTSEALRGRQIETITRAELVKLRDSLGATHITLFARKGDDIVTVESSDPTNIDLSTKGWGFWYTAFDDLFNRRPLAEREGRVAQGFHYENYWVGPISLATYDLEKTNTYVRNLYGYYYDPRLTDFIVNPFYAGEALYNITDKVGPAEVIRQHLARKGSVSNIAVFNTLEFQVGDTPTITDPETDRAVPWGNNTDIVADEKRIVKEVADSGEAQAVPIPGPGTRYKVFVPLRASEISRVAGITVALTPAVGIIPISSMIASVLVLLVGVGALWLLFRRFPTPTDSAVPDWLKKLGAGHRAS